MKKVFTNTRPNYDTTVIKTNSAVNKINRTNYAAIERSDTEL